MTAESKVEPLPIHQAITIEGLVEFAATWPDTNWREIRFYVQKISATECRIVISPTCVKVIEGAYEKNGELFHYHQGIDDEVQLS